jgi:hypothetical protein
MATGEFEIRARPEPKHLPPELERKEVELQMARKRVRQHIEDLRPRSGLEKFSEGINTLRTLKATADMSAVFRQGFPLIATRPAAALDAFKKAFGATFSEFKAEQVMTAIEQADHHYIRQRAKLFLANVNGHITEGEENFLSNLIERTPGLKETIAPVTKASERHAVTFLNLMRVSAFDEFLAKHPNATREELAAWAHFVNVMSGRGRGIKDKEFAGLAGAAIFAPRFAASRIQGPFMAFQYWKLPRVRAAIAKDYAATLALGGTALGLMAAAGAEVDMDPKSSDWGKARFGNTSIDVWGGFQQPMRILARVVGRPIVKGVAINAFGANIGDDEIDPMELVQRFSRYKASPAAALFNELRTGKSLIGKEVEPVDELFGTPLPFELKPWQVTALGALVPMVLADVEKAYSDGGPSIGTAATSASSFFGIGTNTYERGGKKSAIPGLKLPHPKAKKLSLAGVR